MLAIGFESDVFPGAVTISDEAALGHSAGSDSVNRPESGITLTRIEVQAAEHFLLTQSLRQSRSGRQQRPVEEQQRRRRQTEKSEGD